MKTLDSHTHIGLSLCFLAGKLLNLSNYFLLRKIGIGLPCQGLPRGLEVMYVKCLSAVLHMIGTQWIVAFFL